MILTTTNTLDGQPVEKYLGIVTGEAILGANVMKVSGRCFAISWAGVPVPTSVNLAGRGRSPCRR